MFAKRFMTFLRILKINTRPYTKSQSLSLNFDISAYLSSDNFESSKRGHKEPLDWTRNSLKNFQKSARTAGAITIDAGKKIAALPAEFRLGPSFVVSPSAAKRLDHQRSGGQPAGEGFARPTACARSAPVES
jgi:hypothetical protein